MYVSSRWNINFSTMAPKVSWIMTMLPSPCGTILFQTPACFPLFPQLVPIRSDSENMQVKSTEIDVYTLRLNESHKWLTNHLRDLHSVQSIVYKFSFLRTVSKLITGANTKNVRISMRCTYILFVNSMREYWSVIFEMITERWHWLHLLYHWLRHFRQLNHSLRH